SELRYRVESHPVVGCIVAWLHNDDARCPDPLLQQPVVLHGGVRRRHPRVRRHREAGRVVGVHMAVGGIGRRLELGRRGADRIRHLLGLTLANVDSRGGCRDRRHRGSLDEGATCDHFFLPSCLMSMRLHTRPSARKGRHVRLQLRRSTGILAFASVNCLAHRRKGFCMSVVSPHQTIAAEAPRDASPGARPPGGAPPQPTSADRPLARAKRSKPAVPRRLRRSLSLADFEEAARRRLPRMIYGFIAGAVETDAARRDNRRAFDEYGFVPRVLNDVSSRNQMTTLFGMTYAAPFGIPPFASAPLFAYRGDIVLARAAAAANVPMILSAASLIKLEDVRQANPAAWYQAYLAGDASRIEPL